MRSDKWHTNAPREPRNTKSSSNITLMSRNDCRAVENVFSPEIRDGLSFYEVVLLKATFFDIETSQT